MAPHRKYSNGIKLQLLGIQLTSSFRLIRQPLNVRCYKSIVAWERRLNCTTMLWWVSPLPSSFSKKYWPMMPPFYKPHQIDTCSGCIGFCNAMCEFSEPQIRRFCLLTFLIRKWPSSEKIFFFFAKTALSCNFSLAHLSGCLCCLSSWTNWIL